jgi:glucose-6-phosphate dehydrogenase assembly protein OpcA
MSEDVWSAQDTTPGEIEAALRELLNRRHAENQGYVPARVLNLVVVVDREWRGEVANRLERVGRYHPSRTVLCAVEPGRTTLDAQATMSFDADPHPGMLAVTREYVEILMGPQHLEALHTIVDPILVSELITVLWSPHGHDEAVDSMLHITDVLLIDSVEEHDPRAGLARVAELGEKAYIVDLAWLRSTPWRERISSTFDPAPLRPWLRQISGVTVHHQPKSTVAAMLLVGWLATRLEWTPSGLTASNGGLRGHLHSKRQEVDVRLEADVTQDVPGLAGVTVETATGMSISLARGPGGLRAVRRLKDGSSWEWTILGASRGEGGILGEGVRQALLRDPTYRPALDAARTMLG